MAAIQLLTGHHYWLTRTAFTTPFIRAGRSPLSGQPLAHVRWKAAARALAAGQLPCTGSEAAILQIAAGPGRRPAGPAPRRGHRAGPRQPDRRRRRHHGRRRPPPALSTQAAARRPLRREPGGPHPEGTDRMLAKIQSFYGFTKMPFGRDIAPGQLHRHHGHAEAVARLTWAITTRSLAVLTGEVGAGKTVAVRAALAGTDPVRYRPIYLPNPAGIGIRGICQQVVIACGQAPRFHTGSLLPQAADALAAEAAERGRTPILILDEAHQLDPAQLETIRMLTSYDLDSVTCFAALLIGQPTLRTRLRLGVLAALDQRIGLRAHIDGMTRDETASYISHHLALAGRGWVSPPSVERSS